MKMNKKGFTLIELLAIIVILAIIAVITVPIILNIIENARQGAARSSALGYADAIKLAYVEKMAGTASTLGTALSYSVDGTAVTSSQLYVNKEGSDVTCTGINFDKGILKIASCTVTTNGTTRTFSTYENGKFATES